MSSRTDTQSQTKKVIYNVYSYLKKLSMDTSNPEIAHFFRQVQIKTAEACGISETTVKRITAEGNKLRPKSDGSSPSFSSPRKTYKRAKYASEIDDFNADIVRRIIYDFYDKGEYPKSSKILAEFQRRSEYKGSRSSLLRILKSLRFKYKKCNDGRRFLTECPDIVIMRMNCLRTLVNHRKHNDPRPIIYVDEKWVYQNHTKGYIWQNTEEPKLTEKKGRSIICHGGSGSFEFVFGSNIVFKEWFLQMLRLLKEPSVIVMGTVQCHSVLSGTYPKLDDNKDNIQKWLGEKGVEFLASETLSKLREKVRLFVPREKKFEIHLIASEMGHEVVCLPPYHCQYNPIEHIWTQVKDEVKAKDMNCKISDIDKLIDDTLLETVTLDKWKEWVAHCEQLQNEDFIKEGVRNKILEPIRLSINSDEDSDSKDEDDDVIF